MKVIIGENDILPAGEYEITNLTKLVDAQKSLPSGSSPREVLIAYDSRAGQVKKGGVILPPQSLWKLVQTHRDKPIEQFTNEELLAVIRQAENTNVPGSLYQRATNEQRLRHEQKILNATAREKWSSEKVPIGYPQSCNSDQIRNVIQDLSEEKHEKLRGGKVNSIWEKIIDDHIKNGQAELAERRETRRWYEKPPGLIFIGLVIIGVAYFLGWN